MRWRSGLAVLFFLIVGLPSTALAGQAAAPAPPPPPPPRLEGNIDFSYVGITGNTDTKTLAFGGALITRRQQWTTDQKGSLIRSLEDGELDAASSYYRFRAERSLKPRLSVFGEYVYFRDEFVGLAHRHAPNGGLMYKAVDKAAYTMTTDGSLGYLKEFRLGEDNVSSAAYSFRVAQKWTISPTADLKDELRFIGRFDVGDDWHINHNIELSAKMTNLFSLKFAQTISFANRPIIGLDGIPRKGTDTTTSIALVMKFSQPAR
jgi:putative salt-induced outer membrane protein YdiY